MPPKKILPPFLKSGDEVAIISPSWAIDEDKINQAVVFLEKQGLKDLHRSVHEADRRPDFDVPANSEQGSSRPQLTDNFFEAQTSKKGGVLLFCVFADLSDGVLRG